MCKLMIMPGIDAESVDSAWKFVKAISKEMSFGNKDGMGYAAMNSEGELFGERWLKNDEAFDVRNPLTDLEAKLIAEHKGVLKKTVTYNKFGTVEEDTIRAITLHARLATSGKEFYNTHPFVVGNTSLIHNGVVNTKELKLCQSTCDSEGILNTYIEVGVANNINNIQKLADKLEGYYACAVFSEMEDGTKILDIIKDDQASLAAAWVKELNTLVFATTMQTIKDACRTLDFEIVSEFDVRGGHIWRYNAVTGELLGVQKFKPREKGYTDYGSKYWKDLNSSRTASHATKGAITIHPGTSETSHARTVTESTDYEEWEYMKESKSWKKLYNER